jgi:hypothetical protein
MTLFIVSVASYMKPARAGTQDLGTIGLVESGDRFPDSPHHPPRLTYIREHALSLHVG